MTLDQRTASIERHFKYYGEPRNGGDILHAILSRFMT